LFKTENLTVIYGIDKSDKSYALTNVNIELPDTGFVGVIGPSGSGKSTLMHCLSTLKEQTSGEIYYKNQLLNLYSAQEKEVLRRSEFGMVFQRHFLVHYMSAVDNVIIASNNDKRDSIKNAEEMLFRLGLKRSELYMRTSNLSNAQRQRVAIARALGNNPLVLFADEPTSYLDPSSAFAVIDTLREYAEGNLVFVITHDTDILKDADVVIELWDGEISDIKGKVESSE